LAIRRELGDQLGIAGSLSNLGLLAESEGDTAVARSFLDESLSIRLELGDRWGIAASHTNLGRCAEQRGDYADARSHFDLARAGP
jgi:hypothetical protein